jgi:FkbM family methyltransferase
LALLEQPEGGRLMDGAWRRRMLRRALRATEYARAFGFARGTINLATVRSKKELAALSVPGIRSPVYVRPQTTDVYSFEEAFIRDFHHLDIDFDPRLIVDCGANVGYVSVLFANAYPNARIIAIEPEDSNLKVLRLNAASYPSIKIVDAAVWNTQGSVRISNPQDQKDAFRVEAADGGGIRTVTIPGIMEMAGENRIDLLKLDIEGAEREIFSEPAPWLSQVAILMIELHDRIKPGCSLAFFSALSRYDFVEIKRGITYAFLNRRLLDGIRAAYTAPA